MKREKKSLNKMIKILFNKNKDKIESSAGVKVKK